MLDDTSVGLVKELWDKLYVLHKSLKCMPYAEGLKPLQMFTSFDHLMSMGGDSLLRELCLDSLEVKRMLNACSTFLNRSGCCKSLNYQTQPVIGVIYGPTGCGKSQLLRNIISTQLLNPPPETVFFIVPQIDMIPPQEISAWETQICEGNYKMGPQGTLVPQSGSLLPKFVKMSYSDLTQDFNYDVTDPRNVFAKAASNGPIAIILDECMEDMGNHKGIAKFFHAFPSKLHDRYPKCTGYSVLVVLHNMNPRKDHAGNISNLKIQSKLHIISPKMQPPQLNRFINSYTKGLPPAITLLLKDIFRYHQSHTQYDWIVYNTCPENEAMQWCYLHPSEGLVPMYLNVQCKLYSILEKISKVLCDRQRWNRYYHSKK
ncbi:pIVa2 protein [Mastadenovirus porcusquintum]|uniref:PlVa2 protein n=3 Tax=Mastadenovirus TaxID=10509 RepID=Q994E9_9ADEN|nr:plVa2 protein [Porcine adenovirus 5]QBA83634.1 MAG: pIVa2 protein [Porcine adenovirus]BDH21093.1 pIVa2 protein [Porcine mastadenovirus C]AAK26502.1 plVa2 protein [Porcine adenovirus 5]QBA83650.1 MAG: pIVa2 protein [Porcine adenovirus]QBA83665.1 MAG: pIVa2 protein [Porcine adenovirus]